MNPKQAEHRQLEGESLVEAARERDVIVVELAKDVELMREALKALERLVPFLQRRPNGYVVTDARSQARAAITKLEERLLKE